MSVSKPSIFPSLRYDDGAGAIDWLESAFGFTRTLVVPGPEDAIAHAQLTLGNGLVMLGSTAHTPDPANPWDTARFGLYVHVDDIDAHYARAKQAGAEIIIALRETEYGSREYSARDPGGNLWSFGTYQPLNESDA